MNIVIGRRKAARIAQRIRNTRPLPKGLLRVLPAALLSTPPQEDIVDLADTLLGRLLVRATGASRAQIADALMRLADARLIDLGSYLSISIPPGSGSRRKDAHRATAAMA